MMNCSWVRSTLVRISENHAVGIRLTDDASVAVQPGDKVRLTAGRIDVSLMPPDGPLPTNVSQTAASAQLKKRLESTGRFHVQGAERVNAWLLERNVAPAAAVEPPYLQRLTKALKTPYLDTARFQSCSRTIHLSVAAAGCHPKRACGSGFCSAYGDRRGRCVHATTASVVPVPGAQIMTPRQFGWSFSPALDGSARWVPVEFG